VQHEGVRRLEGDHGPERGVVPAPLPLVIASFSLGIKAQRTTTLCMGWLEMHMGRQVAVGMFRNAMVLLT
jgi:hypothetical protein